MVLNKWLKYLLTFQLLFRILHLFSDGPILVHIPQFPVLILTDETHTLSETYTHTHTPSHSLSLFTTTKTHTKIQCHSHTCFIFLSLYSYSTLLYSTQHCFSTHFFDYSTNMANWFPPLLCCETLASSSYG